jgi:hypothetical protein
MMSRMKTMRKITESKSESMSETISKEEFAAYIRVQNSGMTNMFAVNVVEKLSGLTKEQIFAIMKNYDKLAKQYPDIVNGGE